jgi:hypothetical protein
MMLNDTERIVVDNGYHVEARGWWQAGGEVVRLENGGSIEPPPQGHHISNATNEL